MLEKDNGNTAEAICPSCGKQVKVNPEEDIVFCRFCNKPFEVCKAIAEQKERNAEQAKRNKAAKKPSNEAIAKFNAILKQDYKLAETYLLDVIKKEYPPECQSLFKYEYQKSWYYLKSYATGFDSLKNANENLKCMEDSLERIFSVNPHIAKMYYAILCAHVNALYEKEKLGNFSGQLAFVKIRLYDIKKNLYDVSDKIDRPYYDPYNFRREQLKRIEDSVFDCTYCAYPCEYDGSDDIYVDSVIHTVIFCLRGKTNIVLTVEHLTELYSPAKKEKTKKEIAEWKELVKKETVFWKEYADLLHAGKAKKALALLEETKKPSETDEFAKFKKGIFGVKYLGETWKLNAQELAKASIAKSR